MIEGMLTHAYGMMQPYLGGYMASPSNAQFARGTSHGIVLFQGQSGMYL